MDQHMDLLPRRLIFGNPERAVVRISHDVTRIAFLAPVDGVLNLSVAPIERIEDARAVTNATDRNLGPWIVWMHDNRHVLFFRDRAGDENWCAWAINLESGDARALTPQTGVTCAVQQLSRDHPSELLIKHNGRDKRHLDLYRVSVDTAESNLIERNEEGFTGYFTDWQFRVLFAVRVRDRPERGGDYAGCRNGFWPEASAAACSGWSIPRAIRSAGYGSTGGTGPGGRDEVAGHGRTGRG